MSDTHFTVGIVGLGLIGGSMARAYKACGHTVYGKDLDQTTEEYAVLAGIIDAPLGDERLAACDLLMIALYPDATVTEMERIAPLLQRSAVLLDLCGVKAEVTKAGFALAEEYGFTYVGGHPMAGTQFSGIRHSRADLFEGAPMVLVPPRYDDIELLERVKHMLRPAGFGRFSVTTGERHDAVIAFTSQLAHIVSSAYVKSPTAEEHVGFSAGSYKDLTRVAWLNEEMWTELFFQNKDPLLFELTTVINALTAYKTALESGDRAEMKQLLRDGRLRKEKIDG